ncbi:MAG: UDP-N-acetylglucosamine 1-carboxyvinyltransferase [Candidatus Stygibacter australis]|nr:UDP-N-acetylglucosamine 1-carboxyvinyltransferase [Candidatus Stygibacter australis]MDP8322991.1 UDP-N-acetylglucosamine 1-carboxyvinyltransferase [Candidatus Stygibacter australis]
MDRFIINGGKKLSGEIAVSGAKNATLPVMAATILAGGEFVLENIPNLIDIKLMGHLLRMLGAQIEQEEGRIYIDTTKLDGWEAPYDLVSKMRASIYVLGPLLARFGKAKVSFPGGCAIGTRPVDLHLMAMEKLGANIKIEHGYIIAECEKLKGADITFRKVSVGATANSLMAAVLAEGETNLYNCAIEPEIQSFVEFLKQMGADITGAGTSHLHIKGVAKLNPVRTEMLSDRIEAGTFLIAGAITCSEITVTNCVPNHLGEFFDTLKHAGCGFDIVGNKITIKPGDIINPVNITTAPFPEYPTDLQAQFMALMSLCNGESIIEEGIFPDRFTHAAELNRLDANIKVEGNLARVKGVKMLSGAPVMATDLRASAALVLAGLAAQGTTEISRIYHIDRGYENFEHKLTSLGADIKRMKG